MAVLSFISLMNKKVNIFPDLRNQSGSVKALFDEVSFHINQLMESLAYIYERNGVDFWVRNYYDAVLRLLTPVELLNQNYDKKTTPKIENFESRIE